MVVKIFINIKTPKFYLLLKGKVAYKYIFMYLFVYNYINMNIYIALV